jgi:hypothetical protein
MQWRGAFTDNVHHAHVTVKTTSANAYASRAPFRGSSRVGTRKEIHYPQYHVARTRAHRYPRSVVSLNTTDVFLLAPLLASRHNLRMLSVRKNHLPLSLIALGAALFFLSISGSLSNGTNLVRAQ